MNTRQELFVLEYRKDLNATKAAMRSDYYVYCLADPRTQAVFYVGKGVGQRASWHERQTRKSRHPNPGVDSKIKELFAAGVGVQVVKLSIGLTERNAYRIEQLILKRVSGLANIAPGARSYEERLRDAATYLLSQVTNCPSSPVAWVEKMRSEIIAECQSILSNKAPLGTA